MMADSTVAPLVSTPIILGSSSKWRARVLREMGLAPARQMNPDIDEYAVAVPGQTIADRARSVPADLCLAVARAKAAHLLAQLPASGPAQLLVTSDQVAFFDGLIREKPKDEQQCREWFAQYATQPISVCNGVVVTNTRTRVEYVGTATASQLFAGNTPTDVVDAVIADGDIMGCCGGFMVDDPRLVPYLSTRVGTEDELIGLPKRLLTELLLKADEDQRAADSGDNHQQ